MIFSLVIPAFGERNRGKERGIKNILLKLKKLTSEFLPCGVEAETAGLWFSPSPLPSDGEPATMTMVTEPKFDSQSTFFILFKSLRRSIGSTEVLT